MDEAKEKIRELTLQRLRQSGRETAAHQLIEMRKDSNEWKEFVDEIDAVTGGPAESSEDVEWQIAAWNSIQDDPWFD